MNKGGGVLIAVKNNYKCSLCQYDVCDVNQIFVSVELSCNEKILIGAAYFQPSDDVSTEEYSKHIATLEHCVSLYSDHKIVLMGDYNLPKVDWINGTSQDISILTTEAELHQMQIPTLDINTIAYNRVKVIEKAVKKSYVFRLHFWD